MVIIADGDLGLDKAHAHGPYWLIADTRLILELLAERHPLPALTAPTGTATLMRPLLSDTHPHYA